MAVDIASWAEPVAVIAALVLFVVAVVSFWYKQAVAGGYNEPSPAELARARAKQRAQDLADAAAQVNGSADEGMPHLPLDVAKYKETRVFTATDVPKGLVSRHTTAENVWGVIRVAQGRLRYRILDSSLHKGEQGACCAQPVLACMHERAWQRQGVGPWFPVQLVCRGTRRRSHVCHAPLHQTGCCRRKTWASSHRRCPTRWSCLRTRPIWSSR